MKTDEPSNETVVQPTNATHVPGLDLEDDVEFCTELVIAIADSRGVDPGELPPISEELDPDRVNEAVATITNTECITGGSLTLSVYGCTVRVDVDGTVEIRERHGS